MKIRDILQASTELDEAKMGSSSLRAAATKIDGVLVGMEFEMYVPNSELEDPEPEFEPDWEMDGNISTGNWKEFEDDIVRFFSNGEFSDLSGNEVRRMLEREVKEGFDDWVESAWRDHAADNFDEWYEEENPGEDPPRIGTNWYERTLDDFRETYFSDWIDSIDPINDWLKSERMDTYRKFADRFNLNWPYMIDVNEGIEKIELRDIARDFSRSVGMPIQVSDRYHGVDQRPGHYVLEPDSSLDDPENFGDGGLEFKTPPLPINDMIDQLKKVKEWAGRFGCYSNSSTGLHMNVSMPSYSIENLDYIKLALFLGDEYVSKSFERLGNQFAKSSLGEIKSRIKRQGSAQALAGMLDAVKSGMSRIASKIIHSGETNKYMSINTKDDRIEFRAPGNDWLDEDIDKLTDTMMRCIVAMDIALDPEKEKKDYAKKLYKLLSAALPEDDDTIKYFSKYVANELPAVALKSFLRNIQQKRADKKKPPETPKPSAPNEPEPIRNQTAYVIRDRRNNDLLQSFSATSPAAAQRYAEQWADSNDVPQTSTIVQLANPSVAGQEVGTYRITYRRRGSDVDRSMTIDANSRRDAVEEFTGMMPNYDIIRVELDS